MGSLSEGQAVLTRNLRGMEGRPNLKEGSKGGRIQQVPLRKINKTEANKSKKGPEHFEKEKYKNIRSMFEELSRKNGDIMVGGADKKEGEVRKKVKDLEEMIVKDSKQEPHITLGPKLGRSARSFINKNGDWKLNHISERKGKSTFGEFEPVLFARKELMKSESKGVEKTN